jgi:hypothetical protein
VPADRFDLQIIRDDPQVKTLNTGHFAGFFDSLGFKQLARGLHASLNGRLALTAASLAATAFVRISLSLKACGADREREHETRIEAGRAGGVAGRCR